jgi:hypothetical protein
MPLKQASQFCSDLSVKLNNFIFRYFPISLLKTLLVLQNISVTLGRILRPRLQPNKLLVMTPINP